MLWAGRVLWLLPQGSKDSAVDGNHNDTEMADFSAAFAGAALDRLVLQRVSGKCSQTLAFLQPRELLSVILRTRRCSCKAGTLPRCASDVFNVTLAVNGFWLSRGRGLSVHPSLNLNIFGLLLNA